LWSLDGSFASLSGPTKAWFLVFTTKNYNYPNKAPTYRVKA